jgi:acyl-CoA hydrolase
MEIGVRVEAEDMLTGAVVHVASAYLVFVATDERGRPATLPPLVAETDDERRRMAAAEQRRELRLRRPRAS